MTGIALHLVVSDPDAAALWYAEAFGAVETDRLLLPGGRTLTVELSLAGTVLALAGEMPALRMRTPASVPVTSTAFHLPVPDVDAAWRRALAAGATVFEPLHDAFWGDRTGQVLDPSGHRWALDQHVRDVSKEEMSRRAAELLGGTEAP